MPSSSVTPGNTCIHADSLTRTGDGQGLRPSPLVRGAPPVPAPSFVLPTRSPVGVVLVLDVKAPGRPAVSRQVPQSGYRDRLAALFAVDVPT